MKFNCKIIISIAIFLAAALLAAHYCDHNLTSPVDEYPKYGVKHEVIELKLNMIGPTLTGGDVDGFSYIKMPNNRDYILAGVGHSHGYWVLFDRQTKQWTTLLSFVDPRPSRDGYDDMMAHQKEDALSYHIAYDKFTADEDRIIDPIIEHKVDFYHGFPMEWHRKDLNDREGEAPPEASYFEFVMKGSYTSQYRKGGGGWWGGDRKINRKFEQFNGVNTFNFKSKPILQDTEEQMGKNLWVSTDFRILVYTRPSTDSLRFDVLDLSELWNEEGENHASQPAQPAGAR